MRTIPDLLDEHPFFAGFDEAALSLIAGCAVNVHFDTDEYLFHEGGSADRFYVVRHGRVGLELSSAAHRRLVVDTVEDGEVLGWSWLVAPYRWFFDARAVQPTAAVALDGACLRGHCEHDPRLGYAFLQRVTEVMLHRLQAARLRLLDLYGVPGARDR